MQVVSLTGSLTAKAYRALEPNAQAIDLAGVRFECDYTQTTEHTDIRLSIYKVPGRKLWVLHYTKGEEWVIDTLSTQDAVWTFEYNRRVAMGL